MLKAFSHRVRHAINNYSKYFLGLGQKILKATILSDWPISEIEKRRKKKPTIGRDSREVGKWFNYFPKGCRE